MSEQEAPFMDEYGAVYPCPSCGRDSGGPEGAACADCFNAAASSTDEPTDRDLIVGHPFTPATFPDAWPGICGYVLPGGSIWTDGLPCGYAREEHADPGATR